METACHMGSASLRSSLIVQCEWTLILKQVRLTFHCTSSDVLRVVQSYGNVNLSNRIEIQSMFSSKMHTQCCILLSLDVSTREG